MSDRAVILNCSRTPSGTAISGRTARFNAGGLGLGLVLLALLVGCNALDFAPLATATKTVSEVFQTDDAPIIVVETFNGSIDISPGENDEVVVELTKRASGLDHSIAEEALDGIHVAMIQTGDTIHITARRAGRWGGNAGAAVVIAAPPKAQLQLKSSNGHIICEGLQGGIDATTSNGKLEIVEGRGRLDLASSNGGIAIDATDASVTAHTSNGRIEFRGSLAQSDHQFRTSNGRIDLVLPPDSQFALNGSTSNSHIDCDFPIESEGKRHRSRLQGNVGQNPERTISVITSNGHIAIRKAGSRDN
jgi:Putative adhesin